MHQYQERDGEEDRQPGGKTVMQSVDEDALDRTKWKNDIHNHSGDSRWWEEPEEMKTFKKQESKGMA